MRWGSEPGASNPPARSAAGSACLRLGLGRVPGELGGTARFANDANRFPPSTSTPGRPVPARQEGARARPRRPGEHP
jgi:hypothetical protein